MIINFYVFFKILSKHFKCAAESIKKNTWKISRFLRHQVNQNYAKQNGIAENKDYNKDVPFPKSYNFIEICYLNLTTFENIPELDNRFF